jgi:hypothetical protein
MVQWVEGMKEGLMSAKGLGYYDEMVAHAAAFDECAHYYVNVLDPVGVGTDRFRQSEKEPGQLDYLAVGCWPWLQPGAERLLQAASVAKGDAILAEAIRTQRGKDSLLLASERTSFLKTYRQWKPASKE